MEDCRAMKAWKLRVRCRISFMGTANLAEHLLLDRLHPDGPTLFIFCYTAFLKAQMGRLQSKNLGKDDEADSCLKRQANPFRTVMDPSFAPPVLTRDVLAVVSRRAS